MSNRFCEPVRTNRPGRASASTIPCTYDSRSGKRCTSSRMTDSWVKRDRNPRGSVAARERSSGSSRDTYACLGNVARARKVLPDWRGPVRVTTGIRLAAARSSPASTREYTRGSMVQPWAYVKLKMAFSICLDISPVRRARARRSRGGRCGAWGPEVPCGDGIGRASVAAAAAVSPRPRSGRASVFQVKG